MSCPTRRKFVQQAAALSALAALPLASRAHALFNTASGTTLRAAGLGKGLLVGCAVQIARLRDTPDYTALIKQQASILVAEHEFKFAPLRPTPTTFFFDDADYLVHFAEANHMKLRGHNFVWHRALPAWFAGYITPQNAEQLLVHHIETVAGRYKGKIHSWDVVNEAIQISDNQPNGMRNSPWYKALPNYIDIAFRTARRADPNALLTYNDYGIEAEDPQSAAKRAAVLALVKGMQSRGVPIDAVGIQSHIAAGPNHTYGAGLRGFMAELSRLNLQLLLTEMDVNDRDLPPGIPARDAAVAQLYASYLQTTLNNPSVIALLTWGITDRYTWLDHEDSRADGLPERCLPFDAGLKPTPAFSAELNALHHAPARWKGHEIMT
ncbi:MAG TPA: endo-1,4-beta-xylanase [Acidobacteriaceae bacterium]|jgi:endo-1,4-beta-xylanase|nr:endo-1,4-beta-xylanase [Acidobacteriaceae bacterium]